MGNPEGIGGISKARAILARIFGDGENPLAWGIPCGSLLGVRVRVHLIFVLFVLGVLIFTLPGSRAGVVFVLPMLIALSVLVFAHELGHAFVCRRLGGQIDEIMLWPLGGLREGVPPHAWRATLLHALAGPMVNAGLFPVFAGLMIACTGSADVLVFDPFSLVSGINEIQLRDGSTPWWLVSVWAFYVVNLILLGTNALIPMFPLDAGRVVHALIWRSEGHTRGVWVSVHVGIVVALILAFFGVMMEDGKILLALALFGGLVCVAERRKLQFLKYAEMIPGYSTDLPVDAPDEQRGGASEPDTLDVDQILAKISGEGIGSLSRSERRMLKQATEISRKPEDTD